MYQLFKNMLELQDQMNCVVNPTWSKQGYKWYRAIWIECGELVDHYGYKWWKKQEPDMPQVQLEVIDIWHFGLSSLFQDDKNIDQIAQEMCDELEGYLPVQIPSVLDEAEALASNALMTKKFSVVLFWDLMLASGLTIETLYRQYVAKNVLNIFRQDHGYKQGTYIKQWQGREDNEHLVEIMENLKNQNETLRQNLYDALKQRYTLVKATGA